MQKKTITSGTEAENTQRFDSLLEERPTSSVQGYATGKPFPIEDLLK